MKLNSENVLLATGHLSLRLKKTANIIEGYGHT